MVLSYNFEPSITNEVFSPDQLIAGSYALITDTVTLASGLTLLRGTLIGQQSASLYATVTTPGTVSGGTNAGNGTIGTVTNGEEAKPGVYRVNMTAATAFTVLDPNGDSLGTGATGAAFANNQVGFTVTAGGTAFSAGDGFNLDVEATYPISTAAANTAGGSNTGNGTIGTTSVGSMASTGTYRVNMTSATAFNVVAQDGNVIGTGTTGVAFTSNYINFTLTAGGTAFAANDGFNFVVGVAGTGYYVQATATAADGSQDPRNWAVLAEDTNTSASGTNAATSCPVYLAGEFDANLMTFGAGLNGGSVKAALRGCGASIWIKTGALSNNVV